jgi:hypothetical protein
VYRDKLADFFSFRTLIGASFMKVIYIVGAVGLVLGYVWALFAAGPFEEFGLVVLATVYFAVLSIGWRLMCELVVVFFSMHQHLVAIGVATGAAVLEVGKGPSAFDDVLDAPEDYEPVPAGPTMLAAIPDSVSADFDRWTAGDDSARAEFLAGLDAAVDWLPKRVTAGFLRTRFRAAAGDEEFEAIVARRARHSSDGA